MSEGQWQKVAISRAFMPEADFIIFDEPSASLDALSEIQQFHNIGKYFRGKKCCAHLAPDRNCQARRPDRIYEAGRDSGNGHPCRVDAAAGRILQLLQQSGQMV
ncbi:hypothetical protein ACFTAO_27440 [Paenibacillus rhizoplanae]